LLNKEKKLKALLTKNQINEIIKTSQIQPRSA